MHFIPFTFNSIMLQCNCRQTDSIPFENASYLRHYVHRCHCTDLNHLRSCPTNWFHSNSCFPHFHIPCSPLNGWMVPLEYMKHLFIRDEWFNFVYILHNTKISTAKFTFPICGKPYGPATIAPSKSVARHNNHFIHGCRKEAT